MKTAPCQPLQAGDYAPAFALPAVNGEGVVALEDYRGKTSVLLGLFRGLHCPFCRRRIAQLGIARDKLAREGVETVAIVNTLVERARQYFQRWPNRVLLAADAEARTHRAFGVPQIKLLPDDTNPNEVQWPQTATMGQWRGIRVNPTGELPEAMGPFENEELLNKADGFQPTELDRHIAVTYGPQLTGHFLIDPKGIIRWAHVDGFEAPNEIGRFASVDRILAAAQAAARL
jgi:peroxiredoxin